MAAVYGSPARALPDQPGRTTSIEFIEPFERLLRDGRIDGTLESDDPLPDATLLANAVSSPRLVAVLLGAFGVAALVITLAGLAGLVAYSVSLRTREIGIRVALGAQRYEVVWMVLRQAVLLTAAGLVFGHLASLIAGNLLAANLYQMGHYDPLTISSVTPPVTVELTFDGSKSSEKGIAFVGTHDEFAKEVEFKGSVTGKVDGKTFSGDFEEKHEDGPPKK